jgi:hypothetical protein
MPDPLGQVADGAHVQPELRLDPWELPKQKLWKGAVIYYLLPLAKFDPIHLHSGDSISFNVS